MRQLGCVWGWSRWLPCQLGLRSLPNGSVTFVDGGHCDGVNIITNQLGFVECIISTSINECQGWKEQE